MATLVRKEGKETLGDIHVVGPMLRLGKGDGNIVGGGVGVCFSAAKEKIGR